MFEERAECGHLSDLLSQLNKHLDVFQQFNHPDAMVDAEQWQSAFTRLGLNAASDGIQRACKTYVTNQSHFTIHRSAAVLGMGQNSVVHIRVGDKLHLCPNTSRG